MTEEIRTENKCKCLIKCECVKKFIVVALGTFVGFYCALSLFAALHKPPMPHRFHGHNMRPPVEQRFDKFQKGPHGDFHKKFPGQELEKKAFEGPRPQIKD